MTNPNEVTAWLQAAKTAIRERKNGHAQQLLQNVIRVDPQNEEAWLWMSGVEDTIAGKIRSLERVLEINPHNAAAKRGLEQLQNQPWIVAAPSVSSQNTPSTPLTERVPIAAHTENRQPLSPVFPQQEQKLPASAPVLPPSLPPKIESQNSFDAQFSPLKSSPLTPQEGTSFGSVMDELRPMLEASKKKTVPWAAVIILFVAFVVGIMIFLAFLDREFSDEIGVPAAPLTEESAIQSEETKAEALAPVIEEQILPTEVLHEESVHDKKHSLLGQMVASSTYSIRVSSYNYNRSQLHIDLTLINGSNQMVTSSAVQFENLSDAQNSHLTLEPAASSLFSQGTEIALMPSDRKTGQLVYSGQNIQEPFVLHWNPDSNNQSIEVFLSR